MSGDSCGNSVWSWWPSDRKANARSTLPTQKQCPNSTSLRDHRRVRRGHAEYAEENQKKINCELRTIGHVAFRRLPINLFLVFLGVLGVTSANSAVIP